MDLPISLTLGKFLAETRRQNVPDEVLDRTLIALFDTIASALAGSTAVSTKVTHEAALNIFGPGNYPVWFSGQRLGLCGAVLTNATAAFCLDLDDGHRGACGHCGSAVIPAVLAAGKDNDDGIAILAAIALGYDISYRIGANRRMPPGTSMASGRWSGYGAAAGYAWLRGLDADRHAQAIALAGIEGPANLPPHGSKDRGMIKGSIPWSAVTGVAAAERAKAGVLGPLDMFDCDREFDGPRIVADLGHRWLIGESYMKPYACCRYIHAAMDAVMGLVGDRAKDVEEVRVETFPTAFNLPNRTEPDSLEAAQFSFPFCVALAAFRGPSAFMPMPASCLRDAEVLDLAQRVSLIAADDFKDSFPAKTPARVTVRIGNESRSATVLYPKGEVENPMSWKDVEAKFSALADGTITPGHAASIVEGLYRLREGQAGPLLSALGSPPASLN